MKASTRGVLAIGLTHDQSILAGRRQVMTSSNQFIHSEYQLKTALRRSTLFGLCGFLVPPAVCKLV
jgi:redox-sensitive bicupin YhaK (pirin superfamily)